MMTYVDGFVAAVPTANREIYKKHAEAAAVVFKEHGALKLVECWGAGGCVSGGRCPPLCALRRGGGARGAGGASKTAPPHLPPARRSTPRAPRPRSRTGGRGAPPGAPPPPAGANRCTGRVGMIA